MARIYWPTLMEDVSMIISKRYALSLVRKGRAVLRGYIKDTYIIGLRYMTVDRYDLARTDHYEEKQ
jgi:hypothetical protein